MPVMHIGAIFKNEFPYVLEWIAYHRLIGVTGFYIGDNESDDGCSELLCALDSINVIRRFPYKTNLQVSPQMGAYQEILNIAEDDSWVAFIDADEFLRPTSLESGLAPLFDLMRPADGVGSIAINWSVYGSSGALTPSDDLVIRRFECRALRGSGVNRHYKSVVHIGSVAGLSNPHTFSLRRGKNVVQTNGVVIQEPTGLSEEVCWEGVRINHYVIKSRAEFLHKKRPRGRSGSTGGTAIRELDFFDMHDLNHVKESYPEWFLCAVERGVRELIEALNQAGYEISSRSRRKSDFALCRSLGAIGRGVVDEIFVSDGKLFVKGWCVTGGLSATNGLAILVNDCYSVVAEEYKNCVRMDVVNAKLAVESTCGYEAVFPLSSLLDSSCIGDVRFDFFGLTVDGVAVSHLSASPDIRGRLGEIFHAAF